LPDKLFHDPIYGFIQVPECVFRVINDPFFQRLRRVKQLGFSDWVYHGAEHSRFGHCLGAYYIASRLSDRLIQDPKDKATKNEFVLAALLHDIGHHPASHAFERVLNTLFPEEPYWDHEEYTTSIIEKTGISKKIEECGASPENVIKLISGRYIEKSDFQYLNDLISSELDVDRIDYLIRDSYYCGVPYGKIDLERLLYSIEPYEDTVVMNEKCLSTVEMYILSRFYMYTQVYTHRTTRAFDLMLQKVITKEVFDAFDYPKISDDLSRFLNFDDYWLWEILKKLSNEKKFDFKELANGLITRKPLKRVIERQDLKERGTTSRDADYTTISDLRTDDRLSTMTGINKDLIIFDEPWKDLPIYTPYNPGKSNPDDRDEQLILIATKEGKKDIAQLPYSIAYRISKYEADVIRVYTLDEHRKKLGEVIEKIHPKLSPLLWNKQ